jgi:hypothetical protein
MINPETNTLLCSVERLRSVQVYSQAGQFRALRQDFLLSPQNYHLLEDPTVK